MWSNRAAWHIKFPAKWSWDQVTLLRGLERKCIVGKPEDQLFFFLNHKAYDDLWLRTSAFPTGRPPSSNHLFKDMGKWDQREMGEFPWSIVQYLIWYAYTCQLFLSQIREIFALSWTGFPKISQRRPKIPDDFPNVAENVRRCSGELWPLPKPFKRRQFTRVSILVGHKVIIQSSYRNIFVEFVLNFRD